MSEFVPQWTEKMFDAADKSYLEDGFKAACATDDFQRQLRAYVAEQMRGLVPEEYKPEGRSELSWRAAYNKNHCRAETLANIAKWESSRESD